MKSLTIKNVSVQVDFPEGADPTDHAKQAVELINLTLQREPYDLSAQIHVAPSPAEDALKEINKVMNKNLTAPNKLTKIDEILLEFSQKPTLVIEDIG